MSMLHEIKESNTALARRMDKIEDINSTPITPHSHTLGQPPVSPQTSTPGTHQTALRKHMRDPLLNDGIRQPDTQPSALDAVITFQSDPWSNHPYRDSSLGFISHRYSTWTYYLNRTGSQTTPLSVMTPSCPVYKF